SRELASDTPLIYADRQKLRQVFLNLLSNACDAMHKGGRLTIRSGPATLNPGKPGAAIEGTDTGHGIPAESLEKVMEPFFSTKEEGKGTGLGLAICKRIVGEHRGDITISSEVGKGTTVRIELPISDSRNQERLMS